MDTLKEWLAVCMSDQRSAGAAASVSDSVNSRNAADSRAERVLEARTATDIAVRGG
ncbi:hypothetical protein A2U01_0108249, partial [Trifolium medium]|nr:hypothetical protein [Trifolium medium]